MPLLIGYDPSGLDPKIRTVVDEITAAIQTWAGRIEGINAAERLNELTTGISSLPTVPTGALFSWPTATAPTGYLVCDGAAVSRTTYANLFALISTSAGVGDGVSTFNVPDYRGRFLFGTAASGTGSTLMGTFGAIDHTHTGGTVRGSTASESSHTHSVSGTTGDNTNGATGGRLEEVATAGGPLTDVADDGHAHTFSATSGAGSSHSHGVGTLAVGASGAANPPGLAANVIIKT